MTELDVLHWFESLHGTPLDDVVVAITHTGDFGAIWIVIGAVMLLSPRWRRCGIAVIVCTAAAYAANELVLKGIFERPRPFAVDGFGMLVPCPSSWSFPSGHTAASFAGAAAVLLHSRRAGCVAVVYAALVGVSRMYLTVHWPTDVLVGCIFGISVAIVLTWAMSRWLPLYRDMDLMECPFGHRDP